MRRFAVTNRPNAEALAAATSRLRAEPHTRSDEHEWVNLNSPTSTGLLEFLRRQHGQYDALVFFGLMQATSVQGIAVAPERSILFPYVQHHPALRFGLWADLVGSVCGVGLFSHSERPLLRAFMPGASPGEEVVGIGVEPAPQLTYPRHQQDPNDVVVAEDDVDRETEPVTDDDYLSRPGIPFRRRHRLHGPLALYSGRLMQDNGAEEMLEYFDAYSRAADESATLVLMGAKLFAVPDLPHVRQAGVLPNRDRMFAYEAADVTIVPGSDDLLAESLIESLAVGTPVLASARNTAAVDHCQRAGAGLYYSNGHEFTEGLRLLMADSRLRERLGEAGRQYARLHLRWDAVLGRFERLTGMLKRRAQVAR